MRSLICVLLAVSVLGWTAWWKTAKKNDDLRYQLLHVASIIKSSNDLACLVKDEEGR